MNEGDIGAALNKIEKEIDKGNFEAVRKLGFYKVVREVKKNPGFGQKFAVRIGEIDRAFFEAKVWTKLDYKLGTAIELLGAVFGLVFLYLGVTLEGTVSTLLYLASTITLMTALHPISHSIAGRLFGIGFHFYFLNGPILIEPTLKVDYSTYVRVPARKRAIFHLSGAINSVLSTFVVFLAALMDQNTQPAAMIILGIWWLFATGSEVFPIIFIRLGIKKLFFADFKKTDSYRALREWRLGD